MSKSNGKSKHKTIETTQGLEFDSLRAGLSGENKLKSIPEVVLIEWFNDHWYKINVNGFDDMLKSSTTFLGSAPKPWLARFRGDVGNEEADRRLNAAGIKGSNIHDASIVLLNQGAVIYNNPRKPVYNEEQIKEIYAAHHGNGIVLRDQQEFLELYRFKQWFDEVHPKVIAMDMIVYSLTHRFAGTLDFIFLIEKGIYDSKKIEIPTTGLYVADLKTGIEDAKDHPKQIASYAIAYEEGRTERIAGGINIYTNTKIKTGLEGVKTVVYDREELDRQFELFKHIQAIDDDYSTEKPKVINLPSILSLESEAVLS